MPLNYLGELSALLASACFSIGPTLNTLAGQRVRVITLNRVRLLLSLVMLASLHWLIQRTPIPFHIRLENWGFMGLSGLFSLVIGDTLLFAAFNAIGTRLAMLVASLIPVISSLLAWFLLDEKLTAIQAAGILITILGVAWVTLDGRQNQPGVKGRKQYLDGLALAFWGAFFHAAGAIASKKGLSGGTPALSAHLIRTLISLALVWIPMLLRRETGRTVLELRQAPDAAKYLFWGAVFGPVMGMWLSLFAIQNTNVGIATSLASLPPVWLLPVGRYLFKEKIGKRAVFGSLVAVIGVVVLFIRT